MQLQNELLNLFDDMFEDSVFSSMNVPDIMRTDVYELDGNLVMEVELPGYKQQGIKAELRNGYLTIMAVRQPRIEEERNVRHYSMRERHIGGCRRKYYVGEDISQEDIKAAFKNGILTLIIQCNNKRIENRRKAIEIK